MAYLFDVAAESFFPLAPHHTFGRLASVDTQLDKPYISKLHSAIEWNGRCWCIKNLGLNGTWVNDLQLGQGEATELKVNDHIHMAERSEPGFKVIDLAPPSDMLWPLDMSVEQMPARIQPVLLERYHLLPDTQTPELALYFDHQDQAWYAELMSSATEDQRREAIQAGDILQFDNLRWQFIRAQVYGPTEARTRNVLKLNEFEFVFNLSLDEETTQLELLSPLQSIDLGVRSHHYLMLQLARHRAEDAARGLDTKSQGWVYADQLATELGLDVTHMNIHIFRARKQLADCLPDSSDQHCLLERRGGKIRFGCERFKIYKGEQLTTELPLMSTTSTA